MTEFTISSQAITGKTAAIRMAGDMTIASFASIEDEFNKVLDGGIAGILVDITGLDSMTSAGLGALVNLSQVLADRQGKAVVAGPRPKVLGLLEMLGMQEALTIVDTPEKAKKLIASIK